LRNKIILLFTGLMTRVLFPTGAIKGFFPFTNKPRVAKKPNQPPLQWVLEALSTGVKLLGHKADHSPPSSTKVKNAWSYTSTPPYISNV
jgi:hypothetical protein